MAEPDAFDREALADRFHNAALEVDRRGDEEMVTAYLEVTMQVMLGADEPTIKTGVGR